MGNIAILWDLENVNPGNNTLFLDGLIEYAETFGRIVTARAYGNWTNPSFARLAPSLVRRYFFLVHIPKTKGKKNSSDIGLIADSFELLRLYDHIDTYFLVTGDSDFRFLINSLRRAGKKIFIVCNSQNASEDLLALADRYIDFRELLPQEEEEKTEDDFNQKNSIVKKVSLSDWYYLLVEVIESIIKEKKRPRTGLVKMRMKRYNPNFDEKNLNLRSWSDFLTKTARAGFIEIRNERVYPRRNFNRHKSEYWKIYEYLLKILNELDQDKNPQYHELAIVNQKLVNKNIYIKILGFKQFKDFIKGAEARRLIEYKVEGLKHYVKRITNH